MADIRGGGMRPTAAIVGTLFENLECRRYPRPEPRIEGASLM
jgi:hypothetical protein